MTAPRRVEPTRSAMGEFLRQQASRITEDPVTNSVSALAQTLFRDLERGLTTRGELSALIDEAHIILARERAARLRGRHALDVPGQPWQALRQQLEAHASQGFQRFQDALKRPSGGIVFTAHPTFALPAGLRSAIALEASRPGRASRTALKHAVHEDPRGWSRGISLNGEHDEAQRAIGYAADAQRECAGLIFQVAREHFPKDWHRLRPLLPSIASWVGYDLDGRTDIHWSQSIRFRLDEKTEQLRHYASRTAALAERAGKPGALKALSERLARAADETSLQSALFEADLRNPENLVAAANRITAPSDSRLTEVGEIIAALEAAAEAETDDDLRQDSLVLIAQAQSQQLGTARIHLRLNAAQVATVISRELNIEGEEGGLGRLALAELSRRVAASEPLTVNFADLFLEQSTARRQFILCAQILKHIDSGSPIRFLIAESENPATIMAALYLARQYGVADKLDITPLFETPEALETGGRFIERLLDEPEFLTYVRQRGHLSVQFGFSDSGRFIGQVAGNMAIERIHNLILRALAAKAPGIAFLMFNTHGESMGRGGWPGDLARRLDHLLTPWTRVNSRVHAVDIIHESSFQGGDGFLHFATPELACATLAAWYHHALDLPAEESLRDPFYIRTDLVWDFYRALRAWHERIFGNPDYGRLLTEFAPGLTPVAGSRQTRRPSGPAGPRAMRAISHNAALQQLAMPLNSACGIGSALQRENDRLVNLIDMSPRMRSLITLAWHARALTSLPALRAYAAVFNPDVWIAHARAVESEPDKSAAYRRVYGALRDGETALSVNRVANLLATDLSRFDRLLARLQDAPSASSRHADRIVLHILHAVRQALMMRALSLVALVPRISERHNITQRDLVLMVTHLRIGECVELLRQVFPRSQPGESILARLEEAGSSDAAASSYGYDALNADVMDALEEIDGILHRISLALNHPYDAFG